MYYFYRKLPSGKYKYTEPFNSTLDPNYHELINYCRDNKIDWKLVTTYDNKIKFHEEYEILIGSYHLGQGYHGSTESELVDKIIAPNFRVACVLYELRSQLKSIEEMIKQDKYVDQQSCRNFYNFDTNTNSWTGQYFESKKEADKSFN